MDEVSFNLSNGRTAQLTDDRQRVKVTNEIVWNSVDALNRDTLDTLNKNNVEGALTIAVVIKASVCPRPPSDLENVLACSQR